MTLLFNRPILAKSYKVAAWDDSLEDWGTPVETLSLQSMTIETQMATDMANIAGAVEHILALIEAANVTLGMLGWDINVQGVITPMTHSLSGSGAAAVRTLTVPHGNYPYFGLIIQVSLDGDKDLHVGFPYCKLQSSGFDIEVGESAEFSVPELELVAGRLRKADNSTLNAIQPKLYGQETALPSDFSTFFS